jgi:hypothetical protein
MKTRQEMIYDFMVALASNGSLWRSWADDKEGVDDFDECVIDCAEALADRYLRSLG